MTVFPLLERHFACRPPQLTGYESVPKTILAPIKILVVEDEQVAEP
jgi:hypothetical protein